MGKFSVYSTVYYKGEKVTVHGVSALDEIFSVKTKNGEIIRGLRRYELSDKPPEKEKN